MKRLPQKSKLPTRRKQRSTLIVALLVQFAVLGLTVFVIVMDETVNEPPQFEGTQSLQKTKQSFEKQLELAQFARRVSSAKPRQRLSVDRTLSESIPSLPQLPVDRFRFNDGEGFIEEEAQAMLAQSGLSGALQLPRGTSSAAAFFGVQDSGTRIVIIVNTSASVVRKAKNKGVTMGMIQEEVVELIDGLDSGTLFGMVQFSQGSRRFSPYLAPAITRNKEAAANWASSELKGNPPVLEENQLGHEGAFALAMEMEPDLVFLVSDGVLNKRVRIDGSYRYPEIPYEVLIESIEQNLDSRGLRTRIHCVGFELKDKDARGMLKLTRRFGGTLREF